MLPLEKRPDLQVAMDVQESTIFIHSSANDDQILRENKAHRLARTREAGKQQMPMQPKGAKINWHFQVHPWIWMRHMAKDPILAHMLHSKDQRLRERAAEALAREHPEWVVTQPRLRLVRC